VSEPLPLIIFTDLDGTLLNAQDYRCDAALPVLNQLKNFGVPVIPVTSKTRAEVELLRSQLNLSDPFIVENGGGILIPANSERFRFDDWSICHPLSALIDAGYQAISLGSTYAQARDRLQRLSQVLGLPLRGFGDLSADEVAALTGLDREAALRAKTRDFTEPFITPTTLTSEAIAAAAAQLGFRVVVGDRFSHVIEPRSGKGAAIQTLLQADRHVKWSTEAHTPRHRLRLNLDNTLHDHPPDLTVGLGNSPNDFDLLQAVNCPIVIPDEQGKPHPGLAGQGWTIAPAHGAAGWAIAVQEVLQTYARSCAEQKYG